MFKFFSRKDKEEVPDYPQSDPLNKTATQIAIELIEGRGGSVYLRGMKRIFKKTPGLIEDVAPEYQEKLKQLLDGEEI
jgi:hypothetical protein